MQQDEAPRRAPSDPTPVATGPGGVAVPSADGPRRTPAPPRARFRPLTRRAHARVPGVTAAQMERLAFGATGDPLPLATAVSVLPGSGLPTAVRAPVGGADLDALLGDEESGSAPGRHRRPSPLWSFLQHVPGFRSADPASADDVAAADEADAAETTAEIPMVSDTDREDEVDDEFDGEGDEPDVPDEQLAAREPEPAALLVPAQRSQSGDAQLRRRRRGPAPAVRAALQAAARRIEQAPDAQAIARIACEEAARLVEADVTALLLRAVEGPRVLWLHPGGPEADGLWGPATLAALLRVAHPVRRVVEGDPLADGAATALLTVPVPSGGTLAGTLLARRHDDRVFTAGELDVLSRLARMAGAALRSVSRPAARAAQDDDPVTGLPLARRFTADVEAALRTSQRQSIPVSLVAAHVDGLARIRMDLGDPTADEILETLANALRGVLRVGDLAYRVGADELAVLLPATDASGLPHVRARLEGVAAEAFDGVALPGARRPLALRTATVPTDDVPGRSVVDAAIDALQLDRQKVPWSPAR